MADLVFRDVKGAILTKEEGDANNRELESRVNARAVAHNNVAALRALTAAPVSLYHTTLGYTNPGDGGHAPYRWNSASTATDNGGTVIKITTVASGRFELIHDGWCYARQFGTKGDGATDDSVIIQAAVNAIKLVVLVDKHYIAGSINIPTGSALAGIKSSMGHISPNEISNLSPALYLNTAATITLNNASQIRNLVIIRQNMQWNITSAQVAAQFLGTAITIANNTADTVVDECVIIGFAMGIRSAVGATNVSRVRLNRLNMDNIDCVFLQNSYDVCYIDEVHCWPFATVGSIAEAENVQLTRPGIGIQVYGVNDWAKITDCFTYGWFRGMRVFDADSVTFTSCGNDHPQTTTTDGSIGFLIDGDSYECRIIAGQCAAKGIGVYVNTTSTNGTVTLVSTNVWEPRDCGIQNERGTVIASGTVIRATGGVGTGIRTSATSTETRINGGSIRGVSVGLSNASSSTRLFHNDVDFTGTTTIAVNPFKATLASADPLTPDGESQFYEVTGTTNFGSLNSAAAYAGKVLVLKFTGALTVIDGGGSMFLNGNFVSTADDTLTLISDGTAWYEIARSVN